MLEFMAMNAFIHKGTRFREGTKIQVTEEELIKEVALGKTEKGRYMSGLLNHCDPANDETADRLFEIEASKPEKEEKKPKAPTEADIQKEIEDIRAEFGKIGKTFHHKWGLAKLKDELIKAKKETGN